MKLTQEIIIKIVESQETHGCIECGAKYFHTPECRHGFGLSANELIERLKERAVKLRPVIAEQCASCGDVPSGTLWIFYHNTTLVVAAHPYCDRCQELFTQPDGRLWGFVPGIITSSPLVIEAILNESKVSGEHQ